MDGDQQPQLAVGAAQVRLPITATVRNDGASDTGSFRFQFRLRPDDLIFAQGQAASLAPGETVTLQADVPLREPGAYVVQLEVDFTEAVAESSEMNNIEFFSVTLQAEPTDTPTPTDTFTPTPPATETPIPTDTPLPTATFTDTPLPPTATPIPPTDTPVPTMTATLTPCQSADLNADGQVNIFDVRLVGGAVGSRDVDDLARFDFDMDGDIDIFDLRRVSRQYGADCNAVG
ncbi:MAG: hypothetical protein IPK19_34325 [Chloroflexi bacterium]|nr:hypothetical protein [Chloroflexota bacterium]